MARQSIGFEYANYLARVVEHGNDVERMSRHAMKSYLRRHVRVIESQIRALSYRLGQQRRTQNLASVAASRADVWTSWVGLSYLLTERDALLKTLRSL